MPFHTVEPELIGAGGFRQETEICRLALPCASALIAIDPRREARESNPRGAVRGNSAAGVVVIRPAGRERTCGSRPLEFHAAAEFRDDPAEGDFADLECEL